MKKAILSVSLIWHDKRQMTIKLMTVVIKGEFINQNNFDPAKAFNICSKNFSSRFVVGTFCAAEITGLKIGIFICA